MASVNLKDLFDESRYPFGWSVFPFMLYFPFGVALAFIRLFISFQMLIAASIFHDIVSVRRFILKMMCNMVGLIVREDFSETREKGAPVLVANHITQLDYLAFHISSGCVSPKRQQLPSFISWALGFQDMALEKGFDHFSTSMKNHLRSTGTVPVLVQPEGTSTNGRVGLLKFQPEYLSEAKRIQPIALQLWRPPVGIISPCVLGSTWWIELFWFFFVPCTVFFLRYLPTVKRNADEDGETFTKRVEETIAKRLGVECTKYTVSDKTELEKKLTFVPAPPPRRSPSRTVSPEMRRMVAQVAEVLPYVPSDVVLKDLIRTRSVDITISNILEGHITFVPIQSTPVRQQVPVTKQPTTVTSTPIRSAVIGESSSFDTSAPIFAKSAQERTLSFSERKNRLVENARRRYIEKHGLKVAGLSS